MPGLRLATPLPCACAELRSRLKNGQSAAMLPCRGSSGERAVEMSFAPWSVTARIRVERNLVSLPRCQKLVVMALSRGGKPCFLRGLGDSLRKVRILAFITCRGLLQLVCGGQKGPRQAGRGLVARQHNTMRLRGAEIDGCGGCGVRQDGIPRGMAILPTRYS